MCCAGLFTGYKARHSDFRKCKIYIYDWSYDNNMWVKFLTAHSQAIPLQGFSPVSYRGWMHINFKATVKIVFPDFQVFVFAA